MKITKAARAELAQLSKSGVITASAVVVRASDKSSSLHSLFEWDDKKASHAWRIEQARQLIKMVTIHIVAGENRTIRAREYVSLPTDRGCDGLFRKTEDVLGHPTRRLELLRLALSELNALKRKYAHLSELASVFSALDKIAAGSRKVSAVRISTPTRANASLHKVSRGASP